MKKPIDAGEGCNFTGRQVLYDTNIWIFLEYYPPPQKNKLDKYMKLNREIRHNGNEIVINEFIISELYNRCCKMEYEILKSAAKDEGRGDLPVFKIFRKETEFIERAEVVRDTCLNIIDDCKFVPIDPGCYSISRIIEDAARGSADVTDLLIVNQCRSSSFVLVTDDADYVNTDIDLITANMRLLSC